MAWGGVRVRCRVQEGWGQKKWGDGASAHPAPQEGVHGEARHT